MTPSIPRRRLVTAAAAALPLGLAGCASPGTTGSAGGTVLAPAPTYSVGDRWSWRVQSRFRAVPEAVDTMEVVAVGAEGIVVRVASTGAGGATTRTERWPEAGRVAQGALMDTETRRFAQPLERFRFPLAEGERWNQWVEQANETAGTAGLINRYVSVGRMERVSVPAGSFDAVRMTVIMRLDDETPFRYATECSYLVWYAPAVRNAVREERRAQYREKGSGRDGNPPIIAQNDVMALTAYAAGR